MSRLEKSTRKTIEEQQREIKRSLNQIKNTIRRIREQLSGVNTDDNRSFGESGTVWQLQQQIIKLRREKTDLYKEMDKLRLENLNLKNKVNEHERQMQEDEIESEPDIGLMNRKTREWLDYGQYQTSHRQNFKGYPRKFETESEM